MNCGVIQYPLQPNSVSVAGDGIEMLQMVMPLSVRW